MLQDTYHQLWQLLRAFIDLAHASAGALVWCALDHSLVGSWHMLCMACLV